MDKLKPVIIYAYEICGIDKYDGLLKIGQSSQNITKRIEQQLGKSVKFNILIQEKAVRFDGTPFMDYSVHRELKNLGLVRQAGEWFHCTKDDVLKAINNVKQQVIIDKYANLDNDPKPIQSSFYYIPTTEYKQHNFVLTEKDWGL